MRGLDIFNQHFAGFEDCYVLIGGGACTILLEEAGGHFRATKDLDVVLIVENIGSEFAERFWSFVKQGKYQFGFTEQSRGHYYRFEKPENEAFPVMLELFSRIPEGRGLKMGSHLLPLHIADDVSSLSAILLIDEYYDFLKEGAVRVNGISILDEKHLIPFKAKAWCDLMDRHLAGEKGLSKHIKKHVKDVVTLLTLVSEDEKINLSGGILDDMTRFVRAMQLLDVSESTTGVKNMTTKRFCNLLVSLYGLNSIEN